MENVVDLFDCETSLQDSDDAFLEPLTWESWGSDVDSGILDTGSDCGEEKASEERFIDLTSLPKQQKRKRIEAETYGDSSLLASFSKRTKNPNGMPKRPLSAYTCYFQEERMRILEESQATDRLNHVSSRMISFEELAKILGRRWKSMPESEKKRFHDMSAKDNEPCRREIDAWQKNNPGKHDSLKQFSSPHCVSASGASEACTSDRANVQSHGSLRLGFSPLMMNEQDINGLTLNSSSNTSQVPSSYAGSGHSSQTNGLENFIRLVHPSPFAAGITTLLEQHHQMPFEPHCNTHGEFGGFPFQVAGTPPGVMLPGLSSRQLPEPPLDRAVPIGPDMRITLPGPTGPQHYKVQYACYLVTRDEAMDYINKFGDVPLRMGPPPNVPSGGP